MRVIVELIQVGHSWKLLCNLEQSLKSLFLSIIMMLAELGWLKINERTVISKNSLSGSFLLGMFLFVPWVLEFSVNYVLVVY